MKRTELGSEGTKFRGRKRDGNTERRKDFTIIIVIALLNSVAERGEKLKL